MSQHMPPAARPPIQEPNSSTPHLCCFPFQLRSIQKEFQAVAIINESDEGVRCHGKRSDVEWVEDYDFDNWTLVQIRDTNDELRSSGMKNLSQKLIVISSKSSSTIAKVKSSTSTSRYSTGIDSGSCTVVCYFWRMILPGTGMYVLRCPIRDKLYAVRDACISIVIGVFVPRTVLSCISRYRYKYPLLASGYITNNYGESSLPHAALLFHTPCLLCICMSYCVRRTAKILRSYGCRNSQYYWLLVVVECTVLSSLVPTSTVIRITTI